MSLMHHIRRCNAYDPAAYRPFLVAGRRIGSVNLNVLAALLAMPAYFEKAGDGVALAEHCADHGARSAAFAEAAAKLSGEGLIGPLLTEKYVVVRQWGDPPLAEIDRAAISAFGLPAFGVHVNGFVNTPDGLKLWIGRRSLDRRVEPDKLDNIIAGGQPAGLSVAENLIKEAGEEAGLSRDLAASARPVGVLSYCMAGEKGLKPDTLFVYDLELFPDFVPRNTDGEISRFYLIDAVEVLEMLREGEAFKFNVPLVLIDFFIRHGILRPDEESDYVRLVAGLRRSFDF